MDLIEIGNWIESSEDKVVFDWENARRYVILCDKSLVPQDVLAFVEDRNAYFEDEELEGEYGNRKD